MFGVCDCWLWAETKLHGPWNAWSMMGLRYPSWEVRCFSCYLLCVCSGVCSGSLCCDVHHPFCKGTTEYYCVLLTHVLSSFLFVFFLLHLFLDTQILHIHHSSMGIQKKNANPVSVSLWCFCMFRILCVFKDCKNCGFCIFDYAGWKAPK